MFIFLPVFAASCIGYALYSGVTAKSQSRRNEAYRNKVTKYTIKNGHPLSSDYKHLEGDNQILLSDV
jgi:hypothetical protein